MSLDQHIYGSTDWHLPSPSSTPKSVTFPDSTFKTPKAEVIQHNHFLDAWSTPRANGQQTPAQTPSFAVLSPVERPSSSYSLKARTPEDPEFHVNHFIPHNLPLPPVEPARRLSSSPGPLSARQAGVTLRQNSSSQPRSFSMDSGQMQTPPPTRDDNSRRAFQQNRGINITTTTTVISRTPIQVPTSEGLFNNTPYGFPSLQFSPDIVQFPSTGPMSAPPLPHSRLFWDSSNDGNQMDVDMPMMLDPFGSTPHKIEGMNWQNFHTSVNQINPHSHPPPPPPQQQQMNPQAFHALHDMSSPGPHATFEARNNGGGPNSRPSSFISTSQGVDPSMLFSFSSPGPASNTSFNMPAQQTNTNPESRLPYETQARDSLREREQAKKAKSQHSRTSTSSSTASFEGPRPGLQRSTTDSGSRRSRPSSSDSRSSGPTVGHNIPRRSSPLKRATGGPLLSIPEVRRPRTRLVIDETGRARTETVHDEDNVDTRRETRTDLQTDLRRQYPGLWAEDDSDSEPDEPVTLSRNTSFSMPQRRASKHARADSGDLTRSNSFKVSRPSSRMPDKSSFDTIRPVGKLADDSSRRYSMLDFPTSFDDMKQKEDQHMPDSPGDAAGALKKMFEGRQRRVGKMNESERSTQSALKAHNQRWAQASAELANSNNSPQGIYDPFTNSFNGSPATDASLATLSVHRNNISGESTRCVCNSADDGRPMVQCESCTNWLHMTCVGVNQLNFPPVYVCIFCTGTTPIARGGRLRGPKPAPFDSPLTHKSVFRR